MRTVYRCLAFLLFTCSIAVAHDCNIDCNARCCQTIQITPWDKNRVCEPTCKASCEASKAACHATDGGIPAFNTPNMIAKITELLRTSCAAAFQIINDGVIVSQGPYAAGSDALLNQAKDVLIRTGLFPESEFNNVTIRWANLRGEGQAPDRNIVLISETFLHQAPPLMALYSTATTLGHEMVHIGQYRRMGTDNFKCEYSRIYAGCGCQDLGGGRLRCGCQDNRNSLEAEAYSWNAQNNAAVAQAIGFQLPGAATAPPPMSNRICATPALACPMPPNVPIGRQCQCMGPSGPIIGFTR